jgi:hypothetical protein
MNSILLLFASLASQESAALALRPLFDVAPRPERWFPLVVVGEKQGELGGIEVRSPSGRSVWRFEEGASARGASALLFHGRGEATAKLALLTGEEHPQVLGPEVDSPLALSIGEASESLLRERGYRVVRAEAAALSLDPFALDLFDVVSFSTEGARRLAPGAAERIRAAVAAGTRIHAEGEAARLLFGERPPDGLLEDVPPSSRPAPPLALRSSGPRPTPIAFARLRSPAGTFLVAWAVALAVIPAFVRRASPRRGAIRAALGIAGILSASLVPVPLDRPVVLLHQVPSEGRTMRVRLHAPRSAPDLLEADALARPAPPDGRVEALVEGGTRSVRVRGWALSMGGGEAPSPTLQRDPASGLFVDPFGPLEPGVWLRDGSVVGLTPAVGPGEPVPMPGEAATGRPTRASSALVDLLAPRPGLVLLAALPPGRDPASASWILLEVGED